jgi:hypothetical protein
MLEFDQIPSRNLRGARLSAKRCEGDAERCWLSGSPVPHVLSKSEFAASVGVSPSRLSHWLRDGKIDGAAVVGSGYSARINADLARRQLDARLDLSQRLGANGKALFADTGAASASPPSSALDTGIKSARLRQLELSNERAAVEAAAGSGRYVEAEAAKLEMGRIAGRMVAAFDGVARPGRRRRRPVDPVPARRAAPAAWRVAGLSQPPGG